MEYYAHSKKGQPVEGWQKLNEHLQNVANIAAKFAAPFGGENSAYLAGLWHDLGKGSKRFQAYLRHENSIEDEFSNYFQGSGGDHSTAGAKQSYSMSKHLGKLLAYCIAGHHGGLCNWLSDGEHCLEIRLKKEFPATEFKINAPGISEHIKLQYLDIDRAGFQLQLFVRMLFSCLVDADFLDTEKFVCPEKSEFRGQYPSLTELQRRFSMAFSEIRRNAYQSKVNTIRQCIFDDCLAAANLEPGLFSLTVPTGGGKTISSLAFGLKHALKYNKKRIIYVIPFTSIIEQNAAVFRTMLGTDAVLEHHSNFDLDGADWQEKLAVENWDMPIIVTTNVQFFESFYAAKTSKCRKLHNIADSIVIFDEVQAVPVEKLYPCLELLRELSVNYNVTSVLCTATQPALKYSAEFPAGIKNIREIISDVPQLFQTLKRTKLHYLGTCSLENIAAQMYEQQQVLAVVSTRVQALNLFNLLEDASGATFHLSALMYPVHRRRILQEIRKRLERGEPCRVVSTQLIEAGVDIDFPVVYRALAGIDSIAQAAGRCNREGRLTCGEVFIFKPETGLPPGYFRTTAQCAELLLDKFSENLLEPECVHEYFLNYYWLRKDRMDDQEIVKKCNAAIRGNIQFEDIAEFRMIDNNMFPIVVAVEEQTRELVSLLVNTKFAGSILRKLQPYTIQLYDRQFNELKGWLNEPYPGIFVLDNQKLYSEKTGVCLEAGCDCFIC